MYRGTLDPQSNRSTWTVYLRLWDADTQTPFATVLSEMVVEVRPSRGSRPSLRAEMSADQISNPESGVYSWSFTDDQMRTLYPGSYEVGITVTAAGETEQLFLGTLPVVDGVVP